MNRLSWSALTCEPCCCFHRYYFVVEEDNTPLSVTVTPCDAPLEWKLTLQELPEDASGEGSGNYSQVSTVCIALRGAHVDPN